MFCSLIDHIPVTSHFLRIFNYHEKETIFRDKDKFLESIKKYYKPISFPPQTHDSYTIWTTSFGLVKI